MPEVPEVADEPLTESQKKVFFSELISALMPSKPDVKALAAEFPGKVLGALQTARTQAAKVQAKTATAMKALDAFFQDKSVTHENMVHAVDHLATIESLNLTNKNGILLKMFAAYSTAQQSPKTRAEALKSPKITARGDEPDYFTSPDPRTR